MNMRGSGDLKQTSKILISFAKRIPGAVELVGLIRRIRLTLVKTTLKIFQSRLKSYYWREVYFDALNAPYAVSDHSTENYIVKTSDKVIGKLLYCRGDFDLQKLERALSIIDKERVTGKPYILFDIGANIGSICIPAVKRGYVKRAVAYEPDPDNFRLLRINAILNNVEELIEFHQVALGDKQGEAQLSQNFINHGDHRIVVTGEAVPANSITVPVRCLDDFMPDGEDTECILWIDVQGFETQVLCGAQAVLAKTWPLVLEFTPKDLKANGTLDRLIEILTQSAYLIFFDLEHDSASAQTLNSDNLLRLALSLEERDTFTDILFI